MGLQANSFKNANTYWMTQCTYFLDVFLRRVCGETSAALMTLVLEDIRRSFRTAPLNSSLSSILYDAAFYGRLQRTSAWSNDQTQIFRWRKADSVYTKKAEDRWQLLAHHGGSLNTAENWKGPIRARLFLTSKWRRRSRKRTRKSERRNVFFPLVSDQFGIIQKALNLVTLKSLWRALSCS